MTQKSSLLVANLICTASMVVWAAGLPAADYLIPLLAADQLTAMRMAFAALAVLPLWALVEGFGPLRRVNWIKGLFVGGLLGTGAWLLVLGQARGGAVTTAVISATLPLIGITIEVALDGRKMTPALTIGLALSVLGGFLAMDFGKGGLSLGIGALLCFGSVLCYAVSSRLTVTSFPDETALGRTAVTLVGAGLVTALVASLGIGFAGYPVPAFGTWGLREWGAMAIFSVGSLAISQLLWIISVGRLGIGWSALHINAAPFYVMLILFALGGAWDWKQAGAAALVGLGVLIAQGIIGPRR
jgi:drug/metabolite transporter (DMT)-like permease